MKSKMKVLLGFAFAMVLAASQDVFAQCGCTHFVGLTISDYQWDALAKNVKPGDKICFKSGVRTGIEFYNIKGTPEKPVILANMCDGQVTIDAPIAWGNSLSFVNCQYYVVDGSANPAVEYGIEVRGGQMGVNNQGLSTNFEIHHVNVNNTGCSGMLAKTDPTCDTKTQRGNFILRDAIFHHNRIANTGCEGFYIGNSHYDSGKDLVCSGIATKVQEHDIVGVQVYNCVLQDIGNDGIQVGSSKLAVIHHNRVNNVGIKNNVAHQNLIQMGGGTHGALVYNNIVDTGKGYGIYDSGGGGTYYNNIVINALSGAVDLQDFANDYSPTGFRIFNNTFINCSLYGVLMLSENPDPSYYYNNIVVGPVQAGYKFLNLNNPSKNKWVEGNNLLTQDITTVKFVDAAGKDFHLASNATGAIDKGKDVLAYGVNFDYDEKARPKGTAFDIGAFEFQPGGPKASAGIDQSLPTVTTTTTLPGSGTSPTGITSYTWTKTAGATCTIKNGDQATATIEGLLPGTYTFELRVTDATGFDFDNVVVTVAAATANQNPTANAGGPKTITLPTNTITLPGQGADGDGFIQTYAWTKTGGPTTATLGPPTNQPNLALSGLVQGTYTFLLTVTDNKGATGSSSATVTVNAAAVNAPPVVSAGATKTLFLPINSTSLTATASDADGIQTILWEKKTGGTAVLGPPASQLGLNLSGLALGNYTFRCTVTDTKGASAFSEVQVKVLNANQAPVVDAGSSQAITLPTNQVTLNATASDPEGGALTYHWFKAQGPPANAGTDGNPSFTLTNMVQGTYVIGLTVTDASGANTYDEVVISVSVAAPGPNEIPLAFAGGNFSFSLPTNSINLYGSGFDPDGQIVSYVWTKKSGGAAVLQNVDKPTVSITGLVSGQYEFRLRVTDNNGGTDEDIAVVTVSDAGTNIFPVAEAGADKVVRLPQNTVVLDGIGTDDDGQITTYLWSKVSGTGTSIATPGSPTTTVNGLTEGTFIYRLTVTDNDGATDLNDVVVRVVSATANTPPIVSAGTDRTIFLPASTATLAASASDDGTITAYQWVKLGGPAATLTNPTDLDLSLTGLVQGDYTFQLSVTDNNDATVFDIMRLSVLPANFAPPTVDAGSDQEIILPINGIILSGTANSANSTISSTKWTKKLGPNVTMSGDNSLTLTCSAMEVGSFVFELTATDNNGIEVSDNVQIDVLPIPANKPPFVVAGLNTVIKLPINSVTLNGSAVDEDGSVVSVKWTQIAGPVAAAMSGDNTLNLTAASLADGAYIFQLTATDDDGAKGKGDVLVFVDALNSDQKKAPIVYAGEDVVINLKDGVTEYMVRGMSLDPDGAISSQAWTQFGGPAIEFTALEQTLTVNATERGQFGFKFSATDEDGLSGEDDMIMSVIAENDEIPKFFSPNNDGKGDVWVFRNADNYIGCKISVFSRSGQVVYEASPYENNWDGTHNGKPLTNGDYYYNLVCDDGKKIAGAVRIIR